MGHPGEAKKTKSTGICPVFNPAGNKYSTGEGEYLVTVVVVIVAAIFKAHNSVTLAPFYMSKMVSRCP